MTQKFFATDSQTIKKKIFFCDPLRRPRTCLAAWAFAHPSLRHWLLKAWFHYSDFLETNSRRLELVGFQIPLQRLSRDKLSRACGGLVSSLSATSRASRGQTRDVSSLTRVCREEVAATELRIRQSSDKLETSRLCLEEVPVVESGLKCTR
jgi:hypothetical protein